MRWPGAHVFDDFAPKLSDCCHVYAVTRRGYGKSSRPATGYDDHDERAAIIAYVRVNRRRVDARSANLKRSVANAEVIDLPRAGHHVFLTREAEVLSGIRRLMRTVK